MGCRLLDSTDPHLTSGALNRHVSHMGSAVFACAPGRAWRFLGEGLFAVLITSTSCPRSPSATPTSSRFVIASAPGGRRSLGLDRHVKMVLYMLRTQIYITEEQARQIAARAADAGVSKARVIRRMLDEGLGIDDGADERRSAIRATAGIVRDAEGWESWLARVRGGGADERLRRLER
jgi:hypothetical protein